MAIGGQKEMACGRKYTVTCKLQSAETQSVLLSLSFLWSLFAYSSRTCFCRKVFCASNKTYSFVQRVLYFEWLSTICEVIVETAETEMWRLQRLRAGFSLTGEVVVTISFPCKTCILPIEEFGAGL